MLVKSGNGSISMVGGFVMSTPQQHNQHRATSNGFALLLSQLLKRLR